jgi:geranylgeranyl diphosphate synthase type I
MVSDQLARDYLKSYSLKVEPVVRRYFEEKQRIASNISAASGEKIGISEHMVKSFSDFMGGKNIRGALTYFGYDLVKGETDEEILRASVSIQVLHGGILMHDDFMDEDDLRRGKPTIHRIYEKFHRDRLDKGDSRHYGDSMAVDMGDVGIAMDFEILGSVKLPPERKCRAIVLHAQILEQTAFGQAMDITYELCQKVTEEDVLRIHKYKTAYYTIVGPLQVGAILAGASGGVLTAIEEYGVPVGIAFQLRDDELGLYSTEEELGKPIGSDIREGKNTILRIKAMELAGEKDKKFLQYAYGNKRLTTEDVKRVQEITQNCGALEYSQKLSRSLVEKGKTAVSKITAKKKYQELLVSFAELMIIRES